MIINRQHRAALGLPPLRAYVRRLRSVLRLDACDFNVCFVDDREIKRLNVAYRGKPFPTDVLSFPWNGVAKGSALPQRAGRRVHDSESPDGKGNVSELPELKNFLGDVVISVETAHRNARAEGHSLQTEIRWLILHGLLHLLGYDHETDDGQMTAVELSLRQRLGFDGTGKRKPRVKNQKARVKNQLIES